MSHDVGVFFVENQFDGTVELRLVWDAGGGGKSDWLNLDDHQSKLISMTEFSPRPAEGTHVWLQGKGRGVKDKSGESQDIRLSLDDDDCIAVFRAQHRSSQRFQLSFRYFREL